MSDEREQIKAELKVELQEETDEYRAKRKKERVSRNRRRDMWYSFGWIVIGIGLIIADILITRSTGSSPYFGINHPLATITNVGIILIIVGIVTTIWAFVRPRR